MICTRLCADDGGESHLVEVKAEFAAADLPGQRRLIGGEWEAPPVTAKRGALPPGTPFW